MNNFKLQLLRGLSVFAIAFFLFAACKPKEEAAPSAPPPAPPAPVVTNSPVTNAAAEVPDAAAAGTITPEDAKNHVGQMVTVRGKVDRVYVSQKGDVFIDMGGRHPNAAFTAVCFKQAIPAEQLQSYEGKIISVKGQIKNYQGKVEIVLASADQILQ